jgi:putative ABC transport system permease protein
MLLFLRLSIESINFALGALKANLLRTILSLLGVTIGIFSIIAVLTVVDSLEKSIKDSMSFLGDKVIYVQKWPWTFGSEYPWWKYVNRPITNLKEYKTLEKRLENSDGIAIFWNKFGIPVKYGNNSYDNSNIQGVSYEFNKVSDVRIGNGRYFTLNEIESGKQVIIMGYEIAINLFNSTDIVGKTVKIKGKYFNIIGVMERQGKNLLDTPSNDFNLIIPYTSFMTMFPTQGNSGMEPTLAVKGKENDEGMGEIEAEVRGVMRAIRGLKPKEEDNFALNKPELLANVITSTFSIITLAGWVIGGFSILVGGFGIANIMFVSVKERTNIIGIQKSLGAKNYFILFQFLFEAVLLSCLGGAFGLILVYMLTLAVPSDSLKIFISFKNIFYGLGISGTVGLLSGIIPAISASNLDPVEAIRSK